MTQRPRQFYERMSIYTDIHRLRESDHRSIQWIANYLGFNFRTVRKYLSMSLEEYKDFIADKLRSFPDTSAAQMHDWLKEAYPFFPDVCPRTVYNTVMEVRAEANIPKVSVTGRDYRVLPESPSGQYAQVDFGQKKLRKGDGTENHCSFFWFRHAVICNMQTAVQESTRVCLAGACGLFDCLNRVLYEMICGAQRRPAAFWR